MPRATRSEQQGELNHLTARGSGRRSIFEDDADKAHLVELLRKISSEEGCAVFAWCLMDNHAHILVQAPMESISRMMQRMLTAYAHWFNGRHGHIGHVFEGRFTSSPVDDDEHFLAAVKYIHANPRDLGISDVRSYPWSSFSEYMEGTGFCQTEKAIEMLGGIEGFEAFHDLSKEEVGYASLSRRRLSDGEADRIARRVCGEFYRDELALLPVADRNGKLVSLREAGLSVRQIERLTGLGRGLVAKAKRTS